MQVDIRLVQAAFSDMRREMDEETKKDAPPEVLAISMAMKGILLEAENTILSRAIAASEEGPRPIYEDDSLQQFRQAKS